MEEVKVYYSEVSNNLEFSTLYPPERDIEVKNAGCEKAKREKFFSWKLLEYALKDGLGLDISKLEFKKTENGKWSCDRCHFSITHSKSAVAVAVSNFPVGIDMEEVERNTTQLEKLFKNDKLKGVNALVKWTEWESSYKLKGEGSFNEFKEKPLANFVKSDTISVGGANYVLTVASDVDFTPTIKKIKL
ncbi:MAG: hypothetical protein IJA97_05265 [Clostridia bacterium]|nr:hypothetical protein [Clostridia bacterium]